MSKAIADEIQRKFDVPLWAVSHLGKSVRLVKNWRDGHRIFLKDDTGILDGITTRKDGSKRALVLFDNDPISDLVDVPFEYFAAPESPFDKYKNIPGRAGEIAFMWVHGMDLRRRIPRATFYRYRSELLAHSIDIACPFVSTKLA